MPTFSIPSSNNVVTSSSSAAAEAPKKKSRNTKKTVKVESQTDKTIVVHSDSACACACVVDEPTVVEHNEEEVRHEPTFPDIVILKQTDKNVMTIFDSNNKYLFTIVDLVNIFYSSLCNAPYFIPSSIPCKNPYNNLPFTKANLYNIYFFLLFNTINVPAIIHNYFIYPLVLDGLFLLCLLFLCIIF